MQINNYEKAGIIFSQERNALMAYNLFLDALIIEPGNATIWYELGDSLLAFAFQTKSESAIEKALFCLLKSAELDKTNLIFKKAIEDLKKNPHIGLEKLNNIGHYNLDDLKIFSQNILPEHLITFFQNIKSLNNKISLALFLGESRDNKYFELLKHCILNEEDQHIRFSALKRIHYFQEKNNLEIIFKTIVDHKKRENYEPYLSISLSQINTDWSSKMLKESDVDFELVDQTLNYTNEVKEKVNSDDEAKAIIYLSLSKYDLNEVKNFYEFKNERVLIEGLTRNMSKLGFYKLFELNILKENETKLTDYGWKLISDFLDKQTEIKKKELESQISKPKLKWWQL